MSKRRRENGEDERFLSGEPKRREADRNSHPTELIHNSYTVGWVCALPKEQTAATAVLDKRHGNLPKPPLDSNTYTLGSIGQHNVVIACLPKGKYGNTSATNVATLMIRTFPCIKVGLMVGIGGGVPPKVRLGDVVVSTPGEQFPGVVQWDIGKAKQGGKFERTGALNNPPNFLLSALGKLETEHELRGSKIPDYLNELKQKYPKAAKKYLKSASLQDVLFRADYNHVSEISVDNDAGLEEEEEKEDEEEDDDDDEEEENCQFCDKTKIVKRKRRHMCVHYGLIASGNQVIKDAAFRDRLNKDLGNKVLCVEMEAAGLMDNFPCIVIRGVCDYADSHKNKIWQEHAAAVAAAFAKELLNFIQSSDVDAERPLKEILDSMLQTISTTGADIAHVKCKLDRKEDLEILNWLTPIDFASQQGDFISRRQEGTGQWLLNSNEFREWVNQNNKTLFCPGIPGSGKTMSTAIVVNELYSQIQNDPSVGISYVYCNFRRQHEQKPIDLLANLLKQLIQGLPSVPQSIKHLHEQYRQKRTRPSIDEISQAFQSVVRDYSKAFVIVDALDEFQVSDGTRKQFLTELFNLQTKTSANLFITSRIIPEIEREFDGKSIRLEIRANDEDVRRYLDNHMGDLPSFVQESSDLEEKIKSEIIKAVDGMFLLAQLHLSSLGDKISPHVIETALKILPKGTNAYDIAYTETMERITGQEKGFTDLAKRVLSWIICAKRPLTILELRHALAIESDSKKFNDRNLIKAELIVSVCAGLVTIDEESNIIRLVHYTTQEFFERKQSVWFPKAETDIAGVCITYLSFDIFGSGFCQSDEEFEARLRSNPLYVYAAQHWGYHLRDSDDKSLNAEFLKNEAKGSASGQALMVANKYRWSNYSQEVATEIKGVHLAAWFGLAEMLNALLEGRHYSDCKDSRHRTPLSYAAANGHEAVVRLLTARDDVDADSKDDLGRTPLSWAAENRHEAVVRLLTARDDVDADSKDDLGRTPLLWAAVNGHEAVVRLLAARDDVDADSKDNIYSRTSLLWAAVNRHEAVVRLLAARDDVDADLKDDRGQTPLSWAAANGHEAVVRLLAARDDVDADSKDNIYGWTPLSWAAANGHKTVIRLLEFKTAI